MTSRKTVEFCGFRMHVVLYDNVPDEDELIILQLCTDIAAGSSCSMGEMESIFGLFGIPLEEVPNKWVFNPVDVAEDFLRAFKEIYPDYRKGSGND